MKSRYHSVTNQSHLIDPTIIHKTSIEFIKTHRSPKIFTSHSSTYQRYIQSPQKQPHILNTYQPLHLDSISQSQDFKNSITESNQRDELLRQKFVHTLKLNKIQSQSIWSKQLNKQSKSNLIQFLNKKSLQSIQVQNKNLYKTVYSKIGKKKIQLQKKNDIKINIQDCEKIQIQRKQSKKDIQNLFEPFSQEKIIQKYRQLKKSNNKSNPFNLINKLYEINAFSTNKISIFNKEALQDNNRKKSPLTLEAKIQKMINKPPEHEKIKHILIMKRPSCPQPSIKETVFFENKKEEPEIKLKIKPKEFYRINKKPSMDYLKQESIQYKQIKIQKYEDKNQTLTKKISNNLSTQPINQPQVSFPAPKNLQSNTYIIYQVLNQNKFKSPPKVIFEPLKKKQYNGKVHLASNFKMTSQIASLTKIMTCIVVIEICEKLLINSYTQRYKIGTFQTYIGGTSAQLNFGQIYTINELLHGLMLPSGNDASLALARWAGNVLILSDLQANKKNITEKNQNIQLFQWSSQNKFIKYKHEKLKPIRCYNRFLAQMNKKARIIGLTKTSYVNSHGLSNPLNKSCCLDIALLCQYSMKNSYFRSIVSCKQFKTIIQKQVIINEKIMKNSNKNFDPQYLNLAQNVIDKNIISQSEEDEEECEQQEEMLLQKKAQYIKQQVEWVNTHKLLQKKEEYIGIKTGVTATAGPCLASFIKIANRGFIIVVLNSKKLSSRFADTQILKQWILKKENISKHQQKKQQISSVQ